jgi:hypothetical protein
VAAGAGGEPLLAQGNDAEALTGQNELQRLISHIPFRRLAVWGFVVFLAYQLSDFFGVSWQWDEATVLRHAHM